MQKILLASLVSAAFAMPTVAAEQADVVIIGSGGAGLSAAVTAHDLGKKVIVLEKMAMVGGNTNRAAGGLNAAETKPQAKLGIKDSIESHFNDTIKGGHYLNNPDLDHKLTDNAKYSVDFINDLGGDLNDVGMMAGASQKRAHRPTGGGFVGAEVVRTLYKASKDRNIDIRTMADAQKLIVKDGKVVGVQFKQGKKPAQIVHAKAVVIASGGFSANQAMVAKIDPKLKGFATTNQPGATGDGIIIATRHGADTTGMNYVQVYPLATPGTGALQGRARKMSGLDDVIDVNKNGERFVKEDARRDEFVAAIKKQPGGVVYDINDSSIVKPLNSFNEDVETLVSIGRIYKADSLADLAKQLGMPADKLEATVAEFNKMVEAKNDPKFGRKLFDRPIVKPPFYATPRAPSIHHTMGGLQISTNAQVLDKNGKPIPGLYAAGEVTGGIHGSNRLGGNATADVLTFGRIAAKSAVAYK